MQIKTCSYNINVMKIAYLLLKVKRNRSQVSAPMRS